ncbi:MAG: flippase-like domain-containing protein [Deltaproteobacteria bacterium]|nr:flippase-like domain-containing protein [Deltaproteobacteria bacterium]
MAYELEIPKRQNRKLLYAFLAGLIIAVIVFTRADWKRLMVVLSQIEPAWAILSLAFSAASYLFVAAVMGSILRIIGCSLPFRTIFEISFVSTTVNYIMSLGGLSGIALKVYLLARQRISPSQTLSISIVHGFMTNTVLVLLVYAGFIYILMHTGMTWAQMIAAVLILALAFLLTWVTVQIMLSGEFRHRLFLLGMRVLAFINRKLRGRRVVSEAKAREFYRQFDAGMRMIFTDNRKLIMPALCAVLDWASMILCLWGSFKCVNYSINFIILLVGFSVAVFMTIFSFTPAGLGLVEGSVAGVYFALGVPFERALVAVAVYRLSFYILPVLISFIFYRQFFYRERNVSPPVISNTKIIN